MGKMKEHPKYHIISVRLSDAEMAAFEAVRKGVSRQDFMHKILWDAVLRKYLMETGRSKRPDSTL